EGVRRRGFATAVLLGDIFHYFIADPKLETPLLRSTLQGLQGVASRGLSLRYVEGNRDFFVAGSPYAAPFASWALTDGLRIGESRYAFVHGDRVNTADLPYRFWRVVSKNPVAHAALRAIPGPLARAIVARTEARLYRSNFKHKAKLPEAALLAEGRAARPSRTSCLRGSRRESTPRSRRTATSRSSKRRPPRARNAAVSERSKRMARL